MKILCPVDSVDEVARLVELGAGELYGGLISREWKKRFTLAASPNRRSFPEAQIRDEKALRDIVKIVHRSGLPFSLTVNSLFYSREQLGSLLELVSRALDLGVDALIVADVGLILEVRKRWPGVKLYLSTLADVANAGAVAFYRNLGVDRITLPRHLFLSEIQVLAGGSPGVRFDAFVLYGQCPNVEGLCTFSHDHPRRVWPCVQGYNIDCLETGREAEGAIPAVMVQKGWEGLNRGQACGLCALYDFYQLGIEGLKIVGRGTSLERKEWAVETLAALSRALEATDMGREEFVALAQHMYRDHFSRDCHPYLCYFPELMKT